MRTVNVIEGIFFAALEKAAPRDRAAYLDEACGGDAELRRCVERMLAAQPNLGNFLQPPAAESPATTDTAPPLDERPGTAVGPYKLLQQLGEGGFGVVFLAEQNEPVRRKVALKVIKPGMDSKQVVARFEAERQALAMMDHPNIARVLDGGTTDSGRPYFVMELVKGIPITEFCDQNRLTPRERLELFIPVCQAVQHAHQKGVIHRDLKPSNVLVTLYDDRPVPKVIDFGIAKAIEQKLTEQTLFTRVGQVIGTLEYMSPEQASLNALDVDTRADVYALGVLLYELLTGTTPLNKERLQGVAFLEMLRLIREEEPPRPSTRLSESAGGLVLMAAYRKTDSQKLPRLVRGELDWIALKALEKDRSRRYATANALANDVQRYLNDEHVDACPPSVGYRFRKYVRKHKTGVAMAGMAAALLLLGALLSGWQALRATQAEGDAIVERTKAQEERDDALKARQAEGEQRRVAVAAQQKAQEERDAARAEREKVRRLHYTAALNLMPAAWEADNLGRVLELLDEQRPGPDEADLRGFEWHYWDNLCHPELRTLRVGGHIGVLPAVFSGDGTRIAFLASAKPLIESGPAASGPDRQALLEDPRIALKVEMEAVLTVRDLGSERTINAWKINYHSGFVHLQLNQDGTRLAARFFGVPAPKAETDRIVVWDVASSKVLFAKELPSARFFVAARAFALSPDGKLLATSERGDRFIAPDPAPAQIWHVDDLTRPAIDLESSGGADYLAFSADGTRLAGGLGASGPGGPKRIRTWDTATGKPRAEAEIKDARDIALSPDGTRLAAVSRGATGFRGPAQIHVWDCSVPEAPELLHTTAEPHITSVPAGARWLAFSPDGRRLVSASSHGRLVRILDAATGQEHQTIKSTMAVYAASFGADGARLVGSGFLKRNAGDGLDRWDSSVREWAVLPAKAGVKEDLPKDAASWTQTVWSPDGELRAVAPALLKGEVPPIRIHDRTGKQLQVFSGHAAAARVLAFSPDGRLVLSWTANGEVKIWETDSAQVRWEADLKAVFPIQPRRGLDSGVGFSPDGRVVTCPGLEGMRLINTADFRESAAIPGTDPAHCPFPVCCFSPDSRRLVILDSPYRVFFRNKTPGSEKRVLKVWDVAVGREIESTMYEHPGKPTTRGQVTFSPDSRWFALSLSGEGTVTIFDAATGKERTVVKIAYPDVSEPPTVVFSPNGARVLVLRTGGSPAQAENADMTVWDTATGKFLFRLEGHPNAVSPQAVFSPDGKRIATAAVDVGAATRSASIKLWDAATGRELLSLKHDQPGGRLSFSPDGHRLLQHTPDGQGPSWDATPRREAK
jgi:serine/threonine protein kinase/WD40 repeat protein